MLTRISQWPHWSSVRYFSALLTALATAATVAFGAWTYYQARDAEINIQTQNRVVFDIVAAASAGLTLDEVSAQYIDTVSASQPATSSRPRDSDDVLSILLRLTPNVSLDRDRWYVNGSVPLSNLRVFVDDITLGIPQIPNVYRSQRLSGEDIIDHLGPIRRSSDIITLTGEEARRLNAIATVSFQAGSRPVSPDINYSMEDAVGLFGSAFSFYYEYTQWERVAEEWSMFLSRTRESPVRMLESFVNTRVTSVPDSPGLFAAMVGMAAIGALGQDGRAQFNLDLTRADDDCVGPNATTIALVSRPNGDYAIDWGNSVGVVVERDSVDARLDSATHLVDLFREGCVKTLSRVFSDASAVFGTEHTHMSNYVDEWNRIIAERAAASLTLRVTIANVGAFDTYIHRDMRVGIGPRGTEPKILLTLRAADETEAPTGSNPYLAIGTRTPSTHRFRASLSPDIRERLLGSFVSESSYIQVGVVASFGGPNEVVYSPVTPFSDRAREQLRQEVNAILVEF